MEKRSILNPILIERISILNGVISDMDNHISNLMNRRQHLLSTYKKSNKERRFIITAKVEAINRSIDSCYNIRRQTNSELYSLGAI